MVHDFANRVLDLAAIPSPRKEGLHDALLSAVILVERALEQDGDVATRIDLGATVSADSLEFRILEHGEAKKSDEILNTEDENKLSEIEDILNEPEEDDFGGFEELDQDLY